MTTKHTDRPAFNMTVAHAAEHGTRRDLLVALRARLVEALEDPRTQPRDLSPLVLRLRELAAEISEIDSAPEKDEIGEAARVPDGPFKAEEV
jgi:hypothetical protein